MSVPSDQRIAALLDRLTPAIEEQSQWQEIVAEAEAAPPTSAGPYRRSRLLRRPRALLIAAVIIGVVVLAPLSALAVTQGWWFFRFGQAPTPISQVVVVARGVWQGTPWTVTAYRSTTDGICTAFTPRRHPRFAVTAAMGCDQIAGVPVTSQTKVSQPHRISYLAGEGNARFPGYAVGPVIASAATVAISLNDHHTIRVATVVAPKALGADVRFFIARLPAGLNWNPPSGLSPVTGVAGIDAHSRVVARLVIHGRPVNATLYRVSNRGKLVQLSPALRHAFDRAHRSTKIYRLATRNGQSFYRLGGADISRGVAHSCWGVGRAVNPATLPATRGGVSRLAGIIECGPKTATSFPSPQAPVWDLSIYGANRGDKEITLFRLSGIASDAVKTVNLIDDRGRVVERVRVIGNVYALKPVPKGVVAVEPTAFNGEALARCGPGGAAVRGAGRTYLQAHC